MTTQAVYILPSLCLPIEIDQKPTRPLDQDYVGFDTQKASIAFQERSSALYVPDARDGRAISALSLVASAITCRSLTPRHSFKNYFISRLSPIHDLKNRSFALCNVYPSEGNDE